MILTSGKNKLTNVPFSEDVLHMIRLLTSLGADVTVDEANNTLSIDTSNVRSFRVGPEIMKKMRASILVMGPLLARFGAAEVALPGGCVLGARPIDFHLKAFARMGASILPKGEFLEARAKRLMPSTHVLEYPNFGVQKILLWLRYLQRVLLGLLMLLSSLKRSI